MAGLRISRGCGQVEPALLMQVRPVRFAPLAAPFQDISPLLHHLTMNCIEFGSAMRQGIVSIIPAQLLREFPLLIAHFPVHMLLQPLLRTL